MMLETAEAQTVRRKEYYRKRVTETEAHMKDRVNVHLGNYTVMRYDATSKGFALCGT